ncbi:MAG: hypothetical protein ACE5JI_06335 [Acidobacteriota bacterium]
MLILSDSNRQLLRERMEKELVSDVKVTLFTKRESPIIIPGRECVACRETGELLEEITSLSDKLHLEVHDFYEEREEAAKLNINRIPAFLLEGEARGKVRYFGIPAGHEFPSFVDDVIEVSKGSTSLSDSSLESLKALTRDVHIQVFVTPT